MAVQDNQIKAAINEYFFKNRADFEAHKDEILNNSNFYIEDDGLGVVAMQTKMLWTNPSPSSSFAAQTINVSDMSSYDYLLFNFKGANNVEWGFSQLVKKELGHRLFYGDGSGQRVCIRNFTINSGTSITFEAAIYNGASSTTELIPLQIIGIKLVESPTQITNKYSTEETVVGEWIDGKKIYRKVFELDNPISVNKQWVNIVETTINIDKIINSSALSGDTISYYVSLLIRVNNNFIQGYYPDAINVKILILEYTKTTD